MAPRLPLILIGLRGSGKSTLGCALAAWQGAEFVDLDDLTPGLLGFGSPGEAFATAGEAEFRRAEARAFRDVLERPFGGVLSLGGGTPTAPDVAQLLAPPARVVYLRASPRTLRARLMGTDARQRPSLTGVPMLDEIDEVFARRDPLFRSLARVIIESDAMTPEQMLHALEAAASLTA